MTIKIIRHFAEGMRTCANLDAADISSATGRACQVGVCYVHEAWHRSRFGRA